MKRILDSVHGYVQIPEFYMDKIVDTIYFQRLRRVEQTSCRALFPSARHDRFIHSIGVYHLGTLIARSLWEKCQGEKSIYNCFPEKQKSASVIITYRLACLLHDIGHTPFSHTFEKYFDNKDNKLLENLANVIPNDESFKEDFNSQFIDNGVLRFAAHELLSAYIAVKYFSEIITNTEGNVWYDIKCAGDVELLVRMIVGCRYLDDQHSFENAFIELIHGDIIDADGLDYVCRDVWASGYRTASVDVSRLIQSIIVCPDKDDQYRVCYDVKALNEIKSVLTVKDFQNEYVFTHHMLVLEQNLLVEAMKSAAYFHMGTKEEDGGREYALEELCKLQWYEDGIETASTKINLKFPMDDDFLSLMKYQMDDMYVQQWMSRSYNFIPLWKSRESLLHALPRELHGNLNESCWLYVDAMKEFLSQKFDMRVENIMILKANAKHKFKAINNMLMFVDKEVVPYKEIYPEYAAPQKPYFCYIYVPKSFENRIDDIKKKLVQEFIVQYEQ